MAPEEKGCQWMLQMAEGHTCWDWNMANHTAAIEFYSGLVKEHPDAAYDESPRACMSWNCIHLRNIGPINDNMNTNNGVLTAKFEPGEGNNVLIVDITTNTIWGLKNSVDATDKTRCATEENAFGYTTVDELNASLKELDLTKENGGVNFKASAPISSTIGDPRWF